MSYNRGYEREKPRERRYEEPRDRSRERGERSERSERGERGERGERSERGGSRNESSSRYESSRGYRDSGGSRYGESSYESSSREEYRDGGSRYGESSRYEPIPRISSSSNNDNRYGSDRNGGESSYGRSSSDNRYSGDNYNRTNRSSGGYGGGGDHGGGGGGGRYGGYNDKPRESNESSRYGPSSASSSHYGPSSASNGPGNGRRDGGRPSFGGRGGGGGFRGGRGRGESHVAVNPTGALSNLILTEVLPNFRFFLYGISCTDRTGRMIDSRRRRQELFIRGLMDRNDGLLSRLDIPDKDLQNIKRGMFFEGSYCFSSRPIPGLEKERLPRCLVANSTKTVEDGDQTPPPNSENGDSITVMKVNCFTTPTVLTEHLDLSMPESSVPMARLDGQCASCNSMFTTSEALISHCREKNHFPSNLTGDEVPANKEIFLAYCNVALQRALGERMARWGREYIDPKNFTEPSDRHGQKLGVKVFRAYTCEFGIHRPLVGTKKGIASMTLTVDLRAKLLRTKTVLEALTKGYDPNTYQFDSQRQNEALKTWRNEVVICTYDKKCYSVVDLLFEESASSMPVSGLGMSHAEYFEQKKGIPLKYPDAKPLIALLGRNNTTIYLPAELICGNDLEPKLRMQLPSIASFKPCQRHEAIEEIKRFLKPGGQKTKGVGGGLLPALGIILGEERMRVPVEVMPLPTIIAAGVRIPESKSKMWAPCLTGAKFNVRPNEVVDLNVVVIYHRDLQHTYTKVYDRLASLVNNFQATYRFGKSPHSCVRAGDMNEHWGEVERYFKNNRLPSNIFVVDFSKPPRRASSDPAYSTIKQMLGQAGHLSQFINFNTYDHGNPREFKKSNIILQGVARQVLSKCGVRIWWVNIPPSLPLPAIFVGVDVFHAPRKYDPKEKKRTAKESVAAVVVQVIRRNSSEESPMVEIYSETARREAGQEMECGEVLHGAVSRALKQLDVSPASCIVWRDGVGDSTIMKASQQEVPQLRKALQANGCDPTLAYVVCQKRVATKFLTEDGTKGMPVGALINKLQGPDFDTFYINGTSPPYSTPKPVRFVVCNKDDQIDGVSLQELTWALCHDYPNWTGPVKLPSPVQMAHKLAELAGGFVDCGESLNSRAYTNKIHFL